MRKLFSTILCLLLFAPLIAQGAIGIDFTDPIPVPRNSQFECSEVDTVTQFLFGFGCGPAGQFTVTGLILSIINILLVITGMLAVLFVIIGGLRYITAHGNEEQAEGAKNTIQHSIIGLIIVILSFVLIRVIANALIYGAA